MDRLDRIDELDRALVRERGDEPRGNSSEDPSEVSGSERAQEGRPGSCSIVRRDSRMAEPGFNRLGTFSREDDDPNVHDAGGRRPRANLPSGFVGPHPVYVWQGGRTSEIRRPTTDHEPVLRDVSEKREAA